MIWPGPFWRVWNPDIMGEIYFKTEQEKMESIWKLKISDAFYYAKTGKENTGMRQLCPMEKLREGTSI